MSETVKTKGYIGPEPAAGYIGPEPAAAPGARDSRSYTRLQVLLHWSVALLVLLQICVNSGVREAFLARLARTEDLPATLAQLHLAAGLLILALTLLRLILRLAHGAPPPPEGGHPVFEWLGILAHWGLYFLLLWMTLSGAAAWFLSSTLAATLHELGRLAFVALILAHILGAFVEHYVFGNKVIRRMRLR